MITPPYLKKGDKVGIIAPARKIKQEEVQDFTRLLESWGLKWKYGKYLFGASNQYSGTDEERAADFTAMLRDPEIRAIFTARGGYGSLRTLRFTDFSEFEKDPKWITGFSDITVFHSYINTFLNTESLHCMMPLNYIKSDLLSEKSAESIRKALFGEYLEYTFTSGLDSRAGEISAELTGGNLSVLYSLNGTGFFPDFKNKVIFLEDIDEYLYHIDRMMLNLLVSGSLRKIKGLIAGGFTGIKDNEIPFGKDCIEIISESVKDKSIPIAFSFPAGHQKENLALIFGRQVQLRVEKENSVLSFFRK